MKRIYFRNSSIKRGLPRDIRPRNFLMGSLAGAAHLLNNNTGVLRSAPLGQKPNLEHKGKSLLDSRSSVPIHGVKAWPNDPLVSLLFKGRSRR